MHDGDTFPAEQVEIAVRKFQDRANDVLRSDHRNFGNNFEVFLAHCENDPVMSTITGPLKTSTRQETDVAIWHEAFTRTGGSMIGSKRYTVPADDELMLSLFYKFFLALDRDEIKFERFAIDAFGKTRYDEMVWDFNSHFFEKWTREMGYRLDTLKGTLRSGADVGIAQLTIFNVRNLISVVENQGQVAIDSSQVNIEGNLRAEEIKLLADIVAHLESIGEHARATRAQSLANSLDDARPVEAVAVLSEAVEAAPTLLERLKAFSSTVGAGATGSLLAKAVELVLLG